MTGASCDCQFTKYIRCVPVHAWNFNCAFVESNASWRETVSALKLVVESVKWPFKTIRTHTPKAYCGIVCNNFYIRWFGAHLSCWMNRRLTLVVRLSSHQWFHVCRKWNMAMLSDSLSRCSYVRNSYLCSQWKLAFDGDSFVWSKIYWLAAHQ